MTMASPDSVPELLREFIAINKLLEQLIELQREQLAELRRLRVDLHWSGDRLDSAERTLVRAIHGIVANRVFAAAELQGFAAVDGGFRKALAPFGATDARRLGKLLQRVEGRDFGGLQVFRVGEDKRGAIWSVKTGNSGSAWVTPTEPVAAKRGRS
jgi:hypothetical protein